MKSAYAAALVSLGLAAANARATFTLVDNFNSYSVGADVTTGVGSWVQGGSANAGFATVVVDPAGSWGKVLQLSNDPSVSNTSVYQNSGAITIPTGGTGTLFFMMQAKNDGLLHEGTGGMTDDTAPASFGAGRGWTMLGNDGESGNSATPGAGTVGVGDYTQNATNDMADPWGWTNNLVASDDVWYKVWQVYHVDGTGVTGGTYDTYIQGGALFPTQTLIESGYFRGSAAAGALSTMVMLTDDPSVSFFDNIYVDNSNDSHLIDPTPSGVPEPATLAVMGVGMMGLLVRRRDGRVRH